MKKLLTLALALLLIVSAVSCAKTNDKIEENNKNDVVENTAVVFENVDLLAIADSLYAEIPEDMRPMVMSMPLDAEMFEAFAFIPYEEGIEAVVSEPMISSIAHSVVIVKASDAENAERIAAAMKENCDPRKWMCVEADVIEGITNGNLAMLLMTKAESGLADKILAAFNALTPENAPVASEENADITEDELLDEETVEDGEEAVDETADEDTDETEAVDETETKSETKSETKPSEDKKTETSTPASKPVENLPGTKPVYNPETPKTEVVVPESPKVEVILPETPKSEVIVPEQPKVEVIIPEQLEVEVIVPEVPKVEEKPEVEVPKAEEPEVEAQPDTAPEAPAAGNIDDLYALADKLYTGIDPENMPMVGTMELTDESFEYSAFIPYDSSYLAVESMPMMGSQPHSVVIVEAKTAEEAKKIAADMQANADPRKWICVGARSVKSASKDNRAILVMTSVEVMPGEEFDEAAAEAESNKLSEERAQLIIDNFLANA